MGLQRMIYNLNKKRAKKRTGIHFGKFADASIAAGTCVVGGSKLTFGCTWNLADRFPSCLSLASGSRLEVSDDFYIYSGARFAVRGTLKLGSGYINNGCRIFCYERIEIGHDVAIGSDVCIRDTDSHRIVDSDTHRGNAVSAPVIIEDHVWIGDKSVILKGVRIGSGSMVAAGSVVTRDVPPNALVAGVPARVIRENTSWEDFHDEQ